MKRRTLIFLSFAVAIVLATLALRKILVASAEHNLLLITLDTTRADRLGCYGYEHGMTPALDRLAKEGTLFEDAYCNVPLTLPSHATILTGLYPPEHGLRINADKALPTAIPTVSEILSKHDYRTGAFVASAVLDSKFGLDRGFNHYDDNVPPSTGRQQVEEQRYRPGNEVTSKAIEWMDKDDSSPFFCWLHLYDPHFPYHAHEELFGKRFANEAYDSEIAFTDMQVARVMEFLHSRGFDRKTLIVVVGDHGESLGGEHAEPRPFHGYMLYRTTMRIPLIFHMPGRISPARRLSGLVSLTDVFPSILDFLGIPHEGLGSGRSLRPAIESGTLESKPCYGETEFPASFGWSPLQCLTTDKWRYIRTPRPELYNAVSDLGELHNLAEDMPHVVDSLENKLRSIEETMRPHVADAVNLTAADKRRLASLGYLAGGSAQLPSPPDVHLRDIKDMVDVVAMSYEATALTEARKFDEALALWREVVRQSPECPSFRNSMAVAMLDCGRAEEAALELAGLIDSLKSDATLAPSSGPPANHPLYHLVLNNLAYAKARMNRFSEALPLATEAVALEPGNGVIQHTLAIVHHGLGQLDKAEKAARIAVSLEPTNAEHLLTLAEVMHKQGRPEEAVQLAMNALQLEPDAAKREKAKQLLDVIHSSNGKNQNTE